MLSSFSTLRVSRYLNLSLSIEFLRRAAHAQEPSSLEPPVDGEQFAYVQGSGISAMAHLGS
jgi:hypothetical protein